MSNNRHFGQYAQQYDVNEHKIKLKLVHSIKTAKLCKNIASSIFDKPELIDLAYNIGLLHDISRFEQWDTYQTFIDRESFDHGDYSVFLLFDQGLIQNYNINPTLYPYLYIAIKNHNKLQLSEQELDAFCSEFNLNKEIALNLCKIIRDADKLDIIRLLIENPKDMDISPFATQKGYTPEMMNDFKSHHLCDFKNRNSILDFAIGYLAFPFDFNFPISSEIFSSVSEDYANAVNIRYYKQLANPEDKETLSNCCNYLVKQFEVQKNLE